MLVMLGTITIGMTATLLAWRERPEPGATSLVAMLTGQSWWSAFFVLELKATTLGAKMFWSDVQWVGVVVIPVAWLLFALEYTGRDQYVRPRYVGLLLVVPGITVVLAATGEYHSLLYVKSTLVTENGTVMLSRTGGPWYWVVAGYTYLLGLAGSIPLLGVVWNDSLPFRGQSAALLVGTIVPWASNALYLSGGIPVPGLDPTPIAFSISGVAYLSALTRFRLFGTSPSANRRARRLVFERMQDGAVVVDGNGYVVDMNETATRTLGVSPREALGYPAEEILPVYERLPEEGSESAYLTTHPETGERPYDVTVTQITDFHGRTIGRVVTFHDITEHVRQQQRLEVLNRVLRHNIRTETNLIHGYADLLDDDGDGNNAALVKEHTMKIAKTAEKARRVVDIFEQGNEPADATPLADLLRESVASVREEYPAVTVVLDSVPEDVHVDRVLGPVLSNVVENAAEHNTNADPHVWITVETTEESVRVVVEDDGPGIDEYERSVLEGGTESPLVHGSGLGLWLITWGTGIAGGRVTFTENDPVGSVVTVEAPVLSRTEPERSEPNRATP